jgi:hypothetical protein
MKHGPAHTPPSCTVVRAHFSSPHQRTVDHFGFTKTKMPASCIEGMSLNKEVGIVSFHHRQ